MRKMGVRWRFSAGKKKPTWVSPSYYELERTKDRRKKRAKVGVRKKGKNKVVN